MQVTRSGHQISGRLQITIGFVVLKWIQCSAGYL